MNLYHITQKIAEGFSSGEPFGRISSLFDRFPQRRAVRDVRPDET